MSHFKGHEAAGFGGALKNLAMGCASAAGKQMQHSDVTPVVKEKKCVGCGKCVNSCPTKAISIVDKKAICKKLSKNKTRPGRQPVPGRTTEIIRQIP